MFDDAVVLVVVPVEAKLRDPLEISHRVAAGFRQFFHRVARVHLDGDERHNLLAVHLVQLGPGQSDELAQVRHPFLFQHAHGGFGFVLVRERLLALRGPNHAPRGDDHLPGELLHPLFLLHALALLERLPEARLARPVHRRLHLVQPLLRAAVRRHLLVEGELLAVRRVHERGRVVPPAAVPRAVHLQLLDALEHAFEVRLHVERVLGLAQNLEQVVAADEVEPRELLALLLQVRLERFLDLLQLLVHARERVERLFRDGRRRVRRGARARGDDGVLRLHRAHLGGERGVDVVEHDALQRELLPDILRPDEDVLEVHPRGLHLGHQVEHLGHEQQLAFPGGDGHLEHHEKLTRLHRGQRHDVVLQRRVHVLRAPQLVHVPPLLVRHHVHLERRPGLLDRR